jgi:hypothetical protein
VTRKPERRSGVDPAAIQAQIERFLSTCQEPVLLEPGEPAVALRPGSYVFHPRPPGCVLEVWSESGSLVRRIISAGPAAAGSLPLKARTFGGGEIAIEILDKSAKQHRVGRLDGMGRYTKFLTRLLAREFPQHRPEGLTASPDLQRSLSSLYVRGALMRGNDSWALLAAPPETSAETCDQILTFGLLWLSELRRRRRSRSLAGLRLLLPEGRAGVTLQRLPWLDPASVRCDVWEYSRTGEARRREAFDAPPLDLDLPPCHLPLAADGWVRALSDSLASRRGVRWRARPDGLISFEVGGLSFARLGGQTVTYGLENDLPASEATAGRVYALAEHLLRFRVAGAEENTHPLYLARPEDWLAEKVRDEPSALDPTLLPEPLYSGVPTVLGRDRGILDLLGLDASGRLVIIELKASEDIHLPLQALDYWIRVRRLAEEGALTRQGYFPGRTISADAPPRLSLAAPALQFHPQTDTVVHFFSKEISVERIGLSANWRRRLSVEFRLHEGASQAAAPAR